MGAEVANRHAAALIGSQSKRENLSTSSSSLITNIGLFDTQKSISYSEKVFSCRCVNCANLNRTALQPVHLPKSHHKLGSGGHSRSHRNIASNDSRGKLAWCVEEQAGQGNG